MTSIDEISEVENLLELSTRKGRHFLSFYNKMANVCALLILSRKLCSKSHQRDGNVFPRAKQQLEIWKPALVQDAEFNLRIGFNVHIVVSAVVASVTIVTQGCYILHSVQIKQNVGLSECTLVPTCGNWWLTVGLLTGRNYELSLSYVPSKFLHLSHWKCCYLGYL